VKSVRKAVSVLDNIFDGSLTFTSGLSGVLTAFMMLIMVGNILGRRFFLFPIPWSVEFSEYFMVMIIFMGAAWVLKGEGHIIIDVVTRLLEHRTRCRVDSVTSWIMAAILLIITCWGGLATYKDFVSGYVMWKTVLTPVWILDIFIPVGCFLLFIQSVKRARRYWQLARKTSSEDDR